MSGAPPVVLFANSPYMGGMEEHVVMLGRGLVQRGYRSGPYAPPRSRCAPCGKPCERGG